MRAFRGEVLPTEYTDFVRDTIALEQRAREVTRQARDREATFERDAAQNISRLRDDYLARAGRRLHKLSEAEAAMADETIAAQERQFDEAMRRVESAYEKNRDDWAAQLFDRIVGGAV